MEYLDFEVEVAADALGGTTVRVLRSPAGETRAPLTLPWDDLTLENRLQALQIALLRPGSTRRGSGDSTDLEAVRALGQGLFAALLPEPVLALFRVSQDDAREQGRGLRLKLRCDDPRLASLPWEYLYDASGGDFVSLSTATPLVRYVSLAEALEPLEVVPPLRVLGMVVSPDDAPPLDTEHERRRLELAVDRLRGRGDIELEWLAGRSWRYLQATLRRGPWHIVHFIGHGGFDRDRGEGFLVFADDAGRGQQLWATDLGRLLADHDPLRLVVLNACEGGRGNERDLFSSTASVLVRSGAPAVVAMQYEITDVAAIEFSRSFYEALADGAPVDAALAEARKGIALSIPQSFEWGTPVLYTHANDGVLFRAAPTVSAEPDAAPAGRDEPTGIVVAFDPADAAAVDAIGGVVRRTAGVDAQALAIPADERPWDPTIDAILNRARACIVVLGPNNRRVWEREELQARLARRALDPAFHLVPVLAPGSSLPDLGRLPAILSRLRWLDLRAGVDDPAAAAELASELAAPGGAPAAHAASPAAHVQPFRGLEVFDEEHAQFFFGREALTQQLVEQLRDERFLAVVGPSGSGKSSVVRAGLVPQLRRGRLPASDTWPIVVMRPGAHPLETLAARLAPHLGGGNPLAARDSILTTLLQGERGLHATVETALSGGPDARRLVLIVDQFEETFSLCRDEAERGRFVATLLHASSVGGGQTVVVVTMRADFFGRATEIPELAARLAERDMLVPPMEAPELRRAMLEPARLVGLQFEQGLVDTIVTDMGREPGALPLLQHTLLELWERREGGWLTAERYHAIGGVRGAIAQRAEAVYGTFGPEQQAAARRVLLRLIEPSGTEVTRRRATMDELRPAGGAAEDVDAVVEQLVAARLITTSEDASRVVADLAHEALIRGWPRLAGWVEEDRQALRLHRRLSESVAEWDSNGRDPSYLFRGPRLQEIAAWSAQNPGEPSDLERAFIAASSEARAAEARARRRRLQLAAGGVAAAFVAVATLGGVAAINWREAEISQRAANAQFMLALGQQEAEGAPVDGLMLAYTGLGLAQDAPVDVEQFTGTIERLLRTGRYAHLGAAVEQVFPSPDGRYVVVDHANAPGSLVWAADGASIAPLTDEVQLAQFSGDPEAGVVAISYQGEQDGTLGPTELRRLGDGSIVPLLPAFTQVRVSDSHDARVLVVTYGVPPGPDLPPGQDLPPPETGTPEPGFVEASPQPTPSPTPSPSPTPTPERTLESDLPPAELRSTRDGTLIRTLRGPADGGWFEESSGGTIAVVAGTTGGVELVRATDGREIGALRSSDFLVAGQGDAERLVVHDNETGRCFVRMLSTETVLGEPRPCSHLEPSLDRSTVAFHRENAGASLVRVADGELLTEVPADGGIHLLSPDGSLMVVEDGEAGARLVETDGGRAIAELDEPIAPYFEDTEDPPLAFSADGRFLYASTTGSARIYDTTTGQPVELDVPPALGIEATDVAIVEFGPDPLGLAYVGFADLTGALVRLPDLRVIAPLAFQGRVHFWPGERQVLVDGRLADVEPGIPSRLLDATTGTTVAELAGGIMDSVRFDSPSHADAAVVTYSSGWAPDHFALPQIVGRNGSAVPLSGPIENFSSSTADSAVSFSPDGSGFVVRYADGHTEVWDRRGQPRQLIDLGLGMTTTWVGTTGTRLATQDRSGSAYLLDLELLRSLPAEGASTEQDLVDGLCGVVQRSGHPTRVPAWLADRCP